MRVAKLLSTFLSRSAFASPSFSRVATASDGRCLPIPIRATVHRTVRRIGNMNNNDDDEFGDCSFLENVELSPVLPSSSSDPQTSKRRKISTSPTDTCEQLQQWTTPTRLEHAAAAAAAEPIETSVSKNGDDAEEITQTLQKYFGYNSFRTGQREVIQHIIHHRRDVAVFWATGQGKSLCYQIPALFVQDAGNENSNVVLVISPLISLMQDQVHKLNSLSASNVGGKQLATYLGSGQTDVTAEERALNGEVRLVYLTPEKLSSANFLNRLKQLHKRQTISLIAVDEAHCVSEWGFDFRPEFRGVGKALRTDTILSNIPILALTATAVPRVQKDICDSLHLYNPFVSRQSLDRSNLQISVLKKNGVPHAMNDLVSSLNSPGVRSSKQSTIVYAPTRSQVDELTLYLQNNVQKEEENGVRIEAYHAGLSQDARNQAHTKFLTGFTTVIVATVAFGMGIDKPDTRRVIHFGCPKTLEEYYQQIGRAGRDGLPAECTMYVSESDFDRYKTDFYLGGLSGTARQATEASMAALRVYSLDVETCRRKALLSYFKETPAFGERCGTCDACKNAKTYGADSQRDFGPLGARVLLQTIDCLSDQGIGNIVKVVSGSLVESYRYKFGNSPQSVQQTIQTAKEKLSKKYSQTYYKDMISQLAQKGHLIEKTKTTSQNGFDRTYTVYNISSQGREVLTNSKPIILSVPESVRQIERDEEAKRQKILARLAENGIPLHNLPQEEVSTGDGVVIRAYSKWFSYTESLKKSGREERISHMEDLLNRVENWRSATAVKQRIAPASVLSEHMLYSIAYTAATMSPGVKLEATVLEAAGVRSQEIGALVLELGNWVDRVQPKPTSSSPLGSSPGAPSATMVLTETGVGKGWPFAVYKPQKKTGLMVWEQSYVRFAAGESPQTIAMSPSEDRRPVQVKTVVGHILDAIVYGRNVDLQKLASIMAAPTEQEWDQLQSAEASSGMDVTGDPNISGLNGDKFLMTDFVRPILGETLANTPFSDRTEADRDKVAHWFDLLKWYMSLRRAGYNPTFRL